MPDEPLQRRLERILLGGKRRYTRLQVADKAAVPEHRSKRLWQALGFAAAPDDAVVFTDADVEAMRMTDRLIDVGLVDRDLETSVARAMGLHLSRLAEWQSELLWSLIAANPELARDEKKIAQLVEKLLPQLQHVQNYVWRRQLASYAGRALASTDDELEARTQVVGFVDMVGYTRMTRRVEEQELSHVLDRFEMLTTEVVADGHGRIVKMIGDEVLFVADEPRDGAEIALALSERADADGTLPSVRAGLASGKVLSRFGDVYGSVVNLASRLTSLARPGTILADKVLAAALSGEPGLRLRPRRTVAVRGYSRVRPYALRRTHG